MGKVRVTEWESSVDGKAYKFVCQKEKGGYGLEVNGATHTLKGSARSAFLGFDEGFDLDGKPARLVIDQAKEPDIAVDGVYLRSGKKYVQAPMWVMVFAVICLALLIVGGVIGGVFGAVGAMICVGVAKKPIATPAKILICLGVTAAAWVIVLLLAGFIGLLF